MTPAGAKAASTTMASPGAGAAVVSVRGAPVGIVNAKGVPPGAGTSAQRRRSRAAIAMDDVVRGAPPEMLERPSGELLGEVPWDGVAPDPDVLDAVTFLAWL